MDNKVNRRSALENVYTIGPFGVAVDTPGVRLSEKTGLTIFHIEIGEDDLESAKALEKILGSSLPLPCHSTDSEAYRIVCLGPDRWLWVGYDTASDETESRLGAEKGLAVNDVSSSRCVLRLSGRHARDTLSASCTIDLHPDIFSPGSSATTDIDHVVVIIDCVDDDTFDIFVPRGFAVSFWEWLIEAAAEYGGEVCAS